MIIIEPGQDDHVAGMRGHLVSSRYAVVSANEGVMH
jgi:hypothetical protein